MNCYFKDAILLAPNHPSVDTLIVPSSGSFPLNQKGKLQ